MKISGPVLTNEIDSRFEVPERYLVLKRDSNGCSGIDFVFRREFAWIFL
jgi:hypothetical protein